MHLSDVDLNLLIHLKALLEERSVTRAAKRVHLSQPAMSRALERLRQTLHDELLLKVKGGYVTTARGTKLLQEIDQLVPRLEMMWSREIFSSRQTTERVRIVMTDMATVLMLPSITHALPQHAPGLHIEVLPWTKLAYEHLASGVVDLVVCPVPAPPPLKVRLLFKDKFVCLMGDAHPYQGTAVTMKRYLTFKHVAVETQLGQQPFVDETLSEAGHERNICLQVPFLIPAVTALEKTDYVLTCPSRLARQMLLRYSLRESKAPREIPPISYSMSWHPRLDVENLHSWFRGFVLESCAFEFGGRAVRNVTSETQRRDTSALTLPQ